MGTEILVHIISYICGWCQLEFYLFDFDVKPEGVVVASYRISYNFRTSIKLSFHSKSKL